MKEQTTIERTSEREIVVSRTINGPPHLVFEAWIKPELFTRWWIPKSVPITLRSCEMDVRVGGQYRLTFAVGEDSMVFFGTYLEVMPFSRLVWTNEEGGPEVANITTVTFEERDGKTRISMHELYPSKAALEAASGSTDGMPESFDQLDELIVSLPR